MSKSVFSRTAIALSGAALLALVAASSAHAQTATGSGVRPFLGLGVSFGGDKLAGVTYTNGSTANLHAGGTTDFRAGIDWRAPGSKFGVQASVGYFTDKANASNGSISFNRTPLEVMGNWMVGDSYRAGFGLRRVGNGKLSGSGAGSNLGSTSFKGSTGLLGEWEWLYGQNVGIAVRYVSEKYTAPNGVKVDGSHGGFRLNYYF
jgi:hypothetical protein